MKIGSIEIKGRAALAPMAGVTDAAFRQVCEGLGAAYTVSEMISAKAMEYNDKKTASLADITQDQGPVFLQIFGAEPLCMAHAAGKLARLNPAGLPVTVKMRAGWDKGSVNALEVAQACEAAGADAVCVHGRTRDQLYQGRADWDVIRAVKAGVSVPVIGNGDVTDPLSAGALLTETGCDLVMVGRGALGNPWVFRDINAHLRDESLIMPPPTLTQWLLTLRRHIGLMCQYKGEGRAMPEARKHAAWYLKGIRGAAEFRRRAGQLSTLADLDRLVEDIYRTDQEEE